MMDRLYGEDVLVEVEPAGDRLAVGVGLGTEAHEHERVEQRALQAIDDQRLLH